MSDLPDNVISLEDYRKKIGLSGDAILRVNIEEDEIVFRFSALIDKLGEIARLNGDKLSRYELTHQESGSVHLIDSPISLMIYLQTSPEIIKGIEDGTYVLEEITD